MKFRAAYTIFGILLATAGAAFFDWRLGCLALGFLIFADSQIPWAK